MKYISSTFPLERVLSFVGAGSRRPKDRRSTVARSREAGQVASIRDISVEDYDQVRKFLSESIHLYPGIIEWWNTKVEPELKSGERIGLVLDDAGTMGGIAVVRRGVRAKICTIRIHDSLQQRGWGSRLFLQAMKRLLNEGTKQVYVTVSEAAEECVRQFFTRIGFEVAARLKDKYIKGVDELVYSCSARNIVQYCRSALESQSAADVGKESKAENHVTDDRKMAYLVMAVKPQFADLILRGEKIVEFRRLFSKRHVGARVLFYVSAPVSSYQFSARIEDVKHETIGRLWELYNDAGGIDKGSFDSYFAGKATGYALTLSDVRPLTPAIQLRDAREFSPPLIPPQSFKVLESTSVFTELLGKP